MDPAQHASDLLNNLKEIDNIDEAAHVVIILVRILKHYFLIFLLKRVTGIVDRILLAAMVKARCQAFK